MTTALTLAASTGEPSAIAQAVTAGVALISVAILVALTTRLIKVPYTVALVVVGLVIAITGLAPEQFTITHDLVFILFLPPLLFQAGLHIRLEKLRQNALPVALLALPAVVLTTLAVGAVTHALLPEPVRASIDQIDADFGFLSPAWAIALLFGVVLAPTDPISVMAAFKTAGVSERLKTIVEGESLFNDATAVAIFALLLAALTTALDATADNTQINLTLSAVAIGFLKVASIGALVGAVLGVIAYAIIRKLEDHTLETATTIALAWGAFIAAEAVHGSGVIAVVVAALLIGNYGKAFHMKEKTRETLEGFWDSIDFVINSALFLMIGAELSAKEVGGVKAIAHTNIILTAAACFAVLLAARAISVYTVAATVGKPWPGQYKHVVWWAGLKGSLSLAMLLSLPAGEIRSFLMPVAFLVVLASLIAQGATMPTLINKLGIGGQKSAHENK